MNQWNPISLEELFEIINNQVSQMNLKQRVFWESISIFPEKWKEDNYGYEGNGFWALGIYKSNVIWYNDIEEGFSISSYTQRGKIDEYWTNQDELIQALKSMNGE